MISGYWTSASGCRNRPSAQPRLRADARPESAGRRTKRRVLPAPRDQFPPRSQERNVPYATKCKELLMAKPWAARVIMLRAGRPHAKSCNLLQRPTLIAIRSALWLPVSGLDPAGTPVPGCRAGVDDQSRPRSRRPETPAGRRVDLEIVRSRRTVPAVRLGLAPLSSCRSKAPIVVRWRRTYWRLAF